MIIDRKQTVERITQLITNAIMKVVLIFILGISIYLAWFYNPALAIISICLSTLTFGCWVVIIIECCQFIYSRRFNNSFAEMFLSAITFSFLTLILVTLMIDDRYCKVEDGEFGFLKENNNEIKELGQGLHYIDKLKEAYVFPRKKTFIWERNELIITAHTSDFNEKELSDNNFTVNLSFTINLTKEKSLELLKRYKGDLNYIVYSVARPNIKKAISELVKTITYEDYVRERKHYNNTISNIVSTELNSVGLTDKNILEIRLKRNSVRDNKRRGY